MKEFLKTDVDNFVDFIVFVSGGNMLVHILYCKYTFIFALSKTLST